MIMMHPSGRTRASGRHRAGGNRSTELQNFIMRLRRVRRVCRPHFVVVIRLLIVMFTVVELKPAAGHFEDDFWPFVSRFNVLMGIIASILSVIYFDVRVFNFAVLGSIFVKFLFDMRLYERFSVHQSVAWLTFHITAILFSMLVGRRRSIAKQLVFKTSASDGGYYLTTLKNLRHVDILGAGIRLQASILAVDYSLSSRVGGTGFFFTLPFAGLFSAGFSTHKNGTIIILLLLAYAVTNESSPILGFNLVQAISTLAAAVLSLVVGPGLLATDEWLACSKQLYY